DVQRTRKMGRRHTGAGIRDRRSTASNRLAVTDERSGGRPRGGPAAASSQSFGASEDEVDRAADSFIEACAAQLVILDCVQFVACSGDGRLGGQAELARFLFDLVAHGRQGEARLGEGPPAGREVSWSPGWRRLSEVARD